jgi:hypothetical protein
MRAVSRTYPKGTDADPAAAERERIRVLTRELHEAAQEARAAARELRAERAAAVADGRAAIDAYVVQHTTELGGTLRTITGQLNAMYEGFLARLAEVADADMDPAGVEEFMTLSVLRATRRPEFISRVVEAIAGEINADHALVTSHPALTPRRGGGEVLVATPEALAAFRARGGDPGIVIDART